jgi:hypothetical protein
MKSYLSVPVFAALLWCGAARADQADALCAQNPAYSVRVMRAVVQAQLLQDHDPALDKAPPEQVAEQASAQGIAECAAEMRADPSIVAALAGLKGADQQAGWDAYNTACLDHKASRGACITAEVGSAKMLRRMAATDQPPGAKTLLQACELIMQTDPAMAEWRSCVDQALAVHATEAVAKQCKLSATWHVAKTGAEAGQMLTACLRAGG